MSIADKLTTIAENEQKVFNSGREQGLETGYNVGHTEGYEFGYIEGNADGQDAMLIKVWNAIQDNGNRTNYQYAFNYQVWNEETFKPNYDLNFVGETRNVFLSCNFVGSLKTALDKAGVKINTSNCIALYNCFYNMPMLTELPKLDLTKATENLANLFYNCPKLVRIDGIVCSENTKFYSNTFGTSLGSLEECIFSGVIGNNLKLSNCTKLNHDSLMSVINILKDYSSDTSTTAHTLTLGTTLQAKLTDSEKAQATGKGWTIA